LTVRIVVKEVVDLRNDIQNIIKEILK